MKRANDSDPASLSKWGRDGLWVGEIETRPCDKIAVSGLSAKLNGCEANTPNTDFQ